MAVSRMIFALKTNKLKYPDNTFTGISEDNVKIVGDLIRIVATLSSSALILLRLNMWTNRKNNDDYYTLRTLSKICV